MKGGEAQRFGIHQFGLRAALTEIMLHADFARVVVETSTAAFTELAQAIWRYFPMVCDYSWCHASNRTRILRRDQSRIRVVRGEARQAGGKDPSGAKCLRFGRLAIRFDERCHVRRVASVFQESPGRADEPEGRTEYSRRGRRNRRCRAALCL